MSPEKLLSVLDIVEELNAGKAIVKFILKRFEHQLPRHKAKGSNCYPVQTLKRVAIVHEKLDLGILPSQIEKELEDMSRSDDGPTADLTENKDIRFSKDGLQFLTSLFNDIGEQQKRIAAAHEKRAVAEERKAVAIEKRAEAEEKKAAAMNNIASALQEMNHIKRSFDTESEQLTHQAVSMLATEPSGETKKEQQLTDDLSQLLNDAPLMENDDFQDDAITENVDELDDLSTLLDEVSPASESLDDLSLLLDQDVDQNINQENDSLLLDDLSLLIDSDSNESEPDDVQPETRVDDNGHPPLDDLSKLIEDKPLPKTDAVNVEIDDLSLLIDEPAPERISSEMDDLSLLLDSSDDNLKETAEPGKVPDMVLDDLSKLIEPSADKEVPQPSIPDKEPDEKKEKDIPQIEVDVSPDDVKNYKAAIMKLIIGFKTDGKTIEQTTDILNENHIKTLSGKPNWSQKAISQIYKFIESAA